MVPDAEILRVTVEVFTALHLKDFKIKINNRKILDSIFHVCGVPDTHTRPISSAVDKLDKLPWSDVRAEMLQKGIDEATADKIWEYVQLKGFDVLERLKNDPLYQNPTGKAGVDEMETLFSYCE
jgi:histidyl-tRNA synthetase